MKIHFNVSSLFHSLELWTWSQSLKYQSRIALLPQTFFLMFLYILYFDFDIILKVISNDLVCLFLQLLMHCFKVRCPSCCLLWSILSFQLKDSSFHSFQKHRSIWWFVNREIVTDNHVHTSVIFFFQITKFTLTHKHTYTHTQFTYKTLVIPGLQ